MSISELQHLLVRLITLENFVGQNYKVDYSDHDERIHDLENIQAEMRLVTIEQRMNILLLENAKLKLLLEDICHEQQRNNPKPKTRSKS